MAVHCVQQKGSTVDVKQTDVWKNKNVINQLPQYEQAMPSLERKAVYNFDYRTHHPMPPPQPKQQFVFRNVFYDCIREL